MTKRYLIPFEIDNWSITTNGLDAWVSMKGVLEAQHIVEPSTFHTPGVDEWDIVGVPSVEYMTLVDDEGVEHEAVLKGKDTGKIDVDRALADWINVAQFSPWLDQLGRDHIL